METKRELTKEATLIIETFRRRRVEQRNLQEQKKAHAVPPAETDLQRRLRELTVH